MNARFRLAKGPAAQDHVLKEKMIVFSVKCLVEAIWECRPNQSIVFHSRTLVWIRMKASSVTIKTGENLNVFH